jgi:hypothetical protein
VGQSQNAPIPAQADQIKRAASGQKIVPNTHARRPRHLERIQANNILILTWYQFVKRKSLSNFYPKYHHNTPACHRKKSRCKIARPTAGCDQIGTAQP